MCTLSIGYNNKQMLLLPYVANVRCCLGYSFTWSVARLLPSLFVSSHFISKCIFDFFHSLVVCFSHCAGKVHIILGFVVTVMWLTSYKLIDAKKVMAKDNIKHAKHAQTLTKKNGHTTNQWLSAKDICLAEICSLQMNLMQMYLMKWEVRREKEIWKIIYNEK